MVACVRVVGYPWSFLQGSPWQRIVSSFKSRVSCTFSSCICQSKNIISWYPLFFVSALQFEGLFIPMCGIQCLSGWSYVNFACAPWKGSFVSSLMWPWCFSSSAWCATSGKTWKFTSFLFVPSFGVKFIVLIRFYSLGNWDVVIFHYYFGRKIRDLIYFYFRLKFVNNVLSFRKKLL